MQKLYVLFANHVTVPILSK